MDIVLQESKAVQEHVGRVEDRLELKKRDIDRKMTEHDRLRESLQRQDSILTEEEKQRRIQRIEELKTEVEDLRYEANRLLRQSERGIIEPILDSVMETVREVGQREGFDLVLRGELVLYGADAVDLTDRVIEALDSKVIAIPGLSDTPETRTGDTPTSPGHPAPEPSPAPADPLPLIP
jgi:outer membrane protein